MTPDTPQYAAAVVIGRWQLPHLAHFDLIQRALAVAQRVSIVIGSAHRSRNPKNPFTEGERQAMLESMLSTEQRQRVSFVMVQDYGNDKRWADAVQAAVIEIHGQTPVCLVGYQKDPSSYYLTLPQFKSWTFVDAGSTRDVDATGLRDVYFSDASVAASLDVLRPYLHEGVLDYLRAWAELPVYAACRDEHLAVKAYRLKYTAPVYLTADAVVQAADHVLLIKRANIIGRGQWALPGGFLDKDERWFDGAVRELGEETLFELPSSVMEHALKDQAIFDNPGRSPRGRLITQAFYFALKSERLPEVKGADDAKEARWVPVSELPGMVDQLFEDHALILDRFLGILSSQATIVQAHA